MIPPRSAKSEFLSRLPQSRPGPWSKDFAQQKTIWIRCSVCDRQEFLASGFVADAMKRKHQIRIAIKAGWSVAPKPVCPECRKLSP